MRDTKVAILIRFLVCWFFALLLEYPFFMSFFLGNSSTILYRPDSAFAIHLLSAIVLLFSEPKGFGWFDHTRNWPRLFSFLGLMLPVFGVVMTLPIFLICRFRKAEAENTNYFDDEIIPEMEKRSIYDLRSLEDRLIEANDVLSLADIMALADDELKRGAIERLVGLATPEAIHLLMSMRSSPSMEIRFYVTSALDKIRKKFEEEIEAAINQLRDGEYKISARVFLAKVYLQYAESGLVNLESANSYRDEARKHLEYCLETGIVNARATALLLDLLFKQRDFSRAMDVLEKAKLANILPEGKITDYRIHILFESGRFQDLSVLLKEKKKENNLPALYTPLAQWWGLT